MHRCRRAARGVGHSTRCRAITAKSTLLSEIWKASPCAFFARQAQRPATSAMLVQGEALGLQHQRDHPLLLAGRGAVDGFVGVGRGGR